MDRQQVVDVAVQVLQLAQIDLVLLQVVRQGLVQRDQVLQVDTQDGHLEAGALHVGPSVVAVVAPRGEQLCHLAQSLREGSIPVKYNPYKPKSEIKILKVFLFNR